MGERKCLCVQWGWSIWYLGEESMGGESPAVLCERCASPESSRDALKGFKPWGDNVRLSKFSCGGWHGWEKPQTRIPSGHWQEKRRAWIKGGAACLERKGQSLRHFWNGKNKSKALKLSLSWDPVTCAILEAAALPRWPAAAGSGCVKLGGRGRIGREPGGLSKGGCPGFQKEKKKC